ncbi:MAG: orotidine-5'-phosphate decarboxylase [Candidatus Kerfeldbacteria bacterium]|nr:orotidine-5'-phosphate decarboxylase [Candidatus Kerfeldbacteria bacterium]
MKRYSDRAKLVASTVAQKLLLTMEEKETNLTLSADVTKASEMIDLIDKLGDEICMAKIHIDVLEDFTPAVIDSLQELKEKHGILLFEDRKFADIGNTAQMQYAKGIYRIVEWADLITLHAVMGPGMVEGLREIGLPKTRGAVMLATLTPEDNLATPEYTKKALEFAQRYGDFVIGALGRKRFTDDERFLTFTTGVQLRAGGDRLGQTYDTPSTVIAAGSDTIMVGRGIYEATDPLAEAKKYRVAGWQAYEERSR